MPHDHRKVLHDAWDMPLAEIKVLIKDKPEAINAVDSSGSTPLMYFAERASLDAILLLLRYNADIEMHDFSGENALSRAAMKGRWVNRPFLVSTKYLLVRFDLLSCVYSDFSPSRPDIVVALFDWMARHAPSARQHLILWAVSEAQMSLLEVG